MYLFHVRLCKSTCTYDLSTVWPLIILWQKYVIFDLKGKNKDKRGKFKRQIREGEQRRLVKDFI